MAVLRGRSDEDVSRVSEGEGLHPDRLRQWANAVKESRPGSRPPDVRLAAHRGTRARADPRGGRGRDGARFRKRRRHGRGSPPRREKDIVLADFGRSGFAGWFVEDQAFGQAPLRPGEVLLGTEAARPIATLVRGGAWAHSGQLSRRLQGTLRSPSFSIDRRFLHVLAAGKASRVNVVIEHFVMIQDPLYGRLRFILNDDNPRWHTFDLEMWRGRHAYLEFADTTTQDLHDMGPPAGCGPEGYVAVGSVLLSDQGPPALPATVAVIGLLGDEPVHSPLALAERYRRAVSESLAALADGSLPDRIDAEARASLLAWLVEHGLLDLEGPATGRLGASQILPGNRGPAPRAPACPGHGRRDARGRAGLPPRQPEDGRSDRASPDDPGTRKRPRVCDSDRRQRTTGSRPEDRRPGQPADGAGRGEPHLAPRLRPRARPFRGQFRGAR